MKTQAQTTAQPDTSYNKKNLFDGALGGTLYDRLAALTGFGPALYRRAAREIPIQQDMAVLDLGCGTASFALAIAQRIGAGGEIHCLDLSQRQLDCARRKAQSAQTDLTFHLGSMDDLPFENHTFDVVASSLVLHAVSPQVRRDALCEITRVLKPGGTFVLVDLSKPRLGWVAMLWLPSLLLSPDKENRDNVYPALCRDQGLTLQQDIYLNSLVRCQVFRKAIAEHKNDTGETMAAGWNPNNPDWLHLFDKEGVTFIILDPTDDRDLDRAIRSHSGWQVDSENDEAVIWTRSAA